ncbi:unnamed protein product [Rhodiola kirilowii]
MEDGELSKFLSWAAQLGVSDSASCGKTRLSCLGHSLAVFYFPEAGGRGLGAVRNLRKGELILRVPKSALLTRDHVMNGDQRLSLAVVNHPTLSSTQILAVCLLWELGKKRSSKWYPYLKHLPRCYFTLSTFDQFQMQMLQVQCLSWDLFNYAAPGDEPNPVPSSSPWLDETVDDKDVLDKLHVHQSDAYAQRLTDGGFNDADATYCFYARENYRKGEQVLLGYGLYTNLELLEHYGFLLRSNPNDKVFVSLTPDMNSCTSWSKDLLCIDHSGKPSFALLSALRLWATPPNQRKSVSHLAYSGLRHSRQNEIIVMKWLSLPSSFSVELSRLLLPTSVGVLPVPLDGDGSHGGGWRNGVVSVVCRLAMVQVLSPSGLSFIVYLKVGRVGQLPKKKKKRHEFVNDVVSEHVESETGALEVKKMKKKKSLAPVDVQNEITNVTDCMETDTSLKKKTAENIERAGAKKKKKKSHEVYKDEKNRGDIMDDARSSDVGTATKRKKKHRKTKESLTESLAECENNASKKKKYKGDRLSEEVDRKRTNNKDKLKTAKAVLGSADGVEKVKEKGTFEEKHLKYQKLNSEDDLVQGKRYTPKEDAKIMKAVDDYIVEHGLASDGVDKVKEKELSKKVLNLPEHLKYRKLNSEGDLVQGKRYTPEEDAKIMKAVDDYIVEHGLASNGVDKDIDEN